MNKHTFVFLIAIAVVPKSSYSMLAMGRQTRSKAAHVLRVFVRHNHDLTPKTPEGEGSYLGGIIASVGGLGMLGFACYAAGMEKEFIFNPAVICLSPFAGALLTSAPKTKVGSMLTGLTMATGFAAKRYYEENVKPKKNN